VSRRTAEPPPEHVRAGFGVAAQRPELLDGGQGRAWRCGEIVLKPVHDTAESSWLASTFESIQVPGVRLPRPVRSSDGRWVVSGWSAHRFVSGRHDPRFDDIISVGLRMHEALRDVPEPRFLRDRDDVYSWADRLAWGEIEDTDGRIGSGHGARLFQDLAAGRRPVRVRSQIVHADMYANVLFAGTAQPAVVDFTPYWRPPSYAAAVAAVDALAWGDAPIELVERWSDLAEWPQMLRRALLFRLAVALAHPLTSPDRLVPLLSTAERLGPYLD
jgi:uncharacterized protein (TIGR02569 family)